MFDFNEMFKVDNVVGLRNKKFGGISVHQIHTADGLNVKIDWNEFMNPCLSNDEYEIMYIIQLDYTGAVMETFFNRFEDMISMRPEIVDGMFVRVAYNNFDKIGLVVHGRVFYKDSGWDELDVVIDDVCAIWNQNTYGFNDCRNDNAIWGI